MFGCAAGQVGPRTDRAGTRPEPGGHHGHICGGDRALGTVAHVGPSVPRADGHWAGQAKGVQLATSIWWLSTFSYRPKGAREKQEIQHHLPVLCVLISYLGSTLGPKMCLCS